MIQKELVQSEKPVEEFQIEVPTCQRSIELLDEETRSEIRSWYALISICSPVVLLSVNLVLVLLTVLSFLVVELVEQNTGLATKCINYIAGGAYGVSLREDYELYRLVVPLFLHTSANHLFGNVLALIVVGFDCERLVGHWNFVGLYLAGGVAGNFAHMVMNPSALAVGASSGVFAVFGGMLVNTLATLQTRTKDAYLYIRIFFLMLMEEFIPQPGVAYFAHLGGFVAGVLIAFEVMEIPRGTLLDQRMCRLAMRWATGVAAVALLVYFAISETPEETDFCAN